jgi:colanic acid/amylovoran biosynthesis glycosyltransferase
VPTNSNSNLPGVLIYAPHLLPAGQHYVREHALNLQRYRPALAGRRRVPGIPIEDLPSFAFDFTSTRLREFYFLLTGSDRELSAFVRQHKIKLIHAHFGPGGVEIMPLAMRLRIPLVVTFHGWDVRLGAEITGHKSPYERLYRWRLPRLFDRASAIVCVSQMWRGRLLALGCPADKVHTNYLGVDSTFFDGRRGSFDPLSILYVGRLLRQKGVHTLLEALRELLQRQIPAYLTVVGDGPERPHLQHLATEQNLPVRFLGSKTLDEIRELLRVTAVLCAPSTTAGGEPPEALGLVCLEAQAMSVPVVATRNGGMPEALEHGRTGFLVEQSSSAALVDALATLLCDSSLNRSFGQNARSFICDRFDVARCYSALENLYDSLPSKL